MEFLARLRIFHVVYSVILSGSVYFFLSMRSVKSNLLPGATLNRGIGKALPESHCILLLFYQRKMVYTTNRNSVNYVYVRYYSTWFKKRIWGWQL